MVDITSYLNFELMSSKNSLTSTLSIFLIRILLILVSSSSASPLNSCTVSRDEIKFLKALLKTEAFYCIIDLLKGTSYTIIGTS
jgi:hypothetical protein